MLFAQLNHQIADDDLAPIRQSYVTASSLVLANLFRATLLGSVGICFAQMLWRMLRDQSFRVSTIESLFQMRSNPLALASLHVMREGTLLFLIAGFMWVVPVAVTFPPGALTISTQPFQSTEFVNMSVINPLQPDDFDPLQNTTETDYFARLDYKSGGRTASWKHRYVTHSGNINRLTLNLEQ